jgi:hypothetical protein
MKTVYLGFLMVFAIFLAGCAKKLVMTQDISGYWFSTSITYPNDPIFEDIPPDTTPGSARFWFREGDRFEFLWNDTHLVGNYRLSGQQLFLTSDNEDKSTTCQVKLTKERLIIIMDDGFVFEFKILQEP